MASEVPPAAHRAQDRLFQKSLRYVLPSVRPHLVEERELWVKYIFDNIERFVETRSSIGISCACIFMTGLLRGGFGLRRQQYTKFLDLILPLLFLPEIPSTPACEWMKTCSKVLRVCAVEDIPYRVDWQPIFRYAESLTFIPQRSSRPYLPQSFASDFIAFLGVARRFFDAESQEAILAAVRPNLHPFDASGPLRFSLAMQFLPTRPHEYFPISAPVTPVTEVAGILEWGEDWMGPALSYLARVVESRVGYVTIPAATLDALAGEISSVLKLPITPGAGGGDLMSSELQAMLSECLGEVVEKVSAASSAAAVLVYTLVDPSQDGGESVGRLRRVVTALLPFVQVSAEGRSESAVKFVIFLTKVLRDRLRAQSPAATWLDVDALKSVRVRGGVDAEGCEVAVREGGAVSQSATAQLAMDALVAARSASTQAASDARACKRTPTRPHVAYPSHARLSPTTVDFLCETLMQVITPTLQHCSVLACPAFATLATLSPDAAFGHKFESHFAHALRALDRPLMATRLLGCVAVGFCSLVNPCRQPGQACTAVCGRAPTSVDELCRVLRRRGCALRLAFGALPALLSTVTVNDVQRMHDACLTAFSIFVALPMGRVEEDAPPPTAEAAVFDSSTSGADLVTIRSDAAAAVDGLLSKLYGGAAVAKSIREAAEAEGPLFVSEAADPATPPADAPLLSELPDPAFGIGQSVCDPVVSQLGVTSTTPATAAPPLLINDAAWLPQGETSTSVFDLAAHVRKTARDLAKAFPTWVVQFVSRVLHTSRYLDTEGASSELIYAVTVTVGAASQATQVEILKATAASVVDGTAVAEDTGKPTKAYFKLLRGVAAAAPTLAASLLFVPILQRIFRHCEAADGDPTTTSASGVASGGVNVEGALLGLAPLDAVHLFAAAAAVAGASPLVIASAPAGVRPLLVELVRRTLSRRSIAALGTSHRGPVGQSLRVVALFVKDVLGVLPLPTVLDCIRPVPSYAKVSKPPVAIAGASSGKDVGDGVKGAACMPSPSSPPPAHGEAFDCEKECVSSVDGGDDDDDDDQDAMFGGCSDASKVPPPPSGTRAPYPPQGEGVFMSRSDVAVAYAEPTEASVALAVALFNASAAGALEVICDGVATAGVGVAHTVASAGSGGVPSLAAADAAVYPAPTLLAKESKLGTILRQRVHAFTQELASQLPYPTPSPKGSAAGAAATEVATTLDENMKTVLRAALRTFNICIQGVAPNMLEPLPPGSYDSEPALASMGLVTSPITYRTGGPVERFPHLRERMLVTSSELAEMFSDLVHAQQLLLGLERAAEDPSVDTKASSGAVAQGGPLSPLGGATITCRAASDPEVLEAWTEVLDTVAEPEDDTPVNAYGIRMQLMAFGCVHRAVARLPQMCKVLEEVCERSRRLLDYHGGDLYHRALLAAEALALGPFEGVATAARGLHNSMVRSLHYDEGRDVGVRLVARFDRGTLRTRLPLDGSMLGGNARKGTCASIYKPEQVVLGVGQGTSNASPDDTPTAAGRAHGRDRVLDAPVGPPHRESDVVGICTLVEQSESTLLLQSDLLIRFITACAALPLTPLLNDLEKIDGASARATAEATVAGVLDALSSGHVTRPAQISSAHASPLDSPIHAPIRAIVYRGGHVLGTLISDAVRSKTISFDSVENMLRAMRFFARVSTPLGVPSMAVPKTLLRSLFDVLAATHNDTAVMWVIRILFLYTPRAVKVEVPRAEVLKELKIADPAEWLPINPYPHPFRSARDARSADVAAAAGEVVEIKHALDNFADGYYRLPPTLRLRDRNMPLETRPPAVKPDPEGVAIAHVEVISSLRQLIKELEAVLPLGEQMALRWALDGSRDEAALSVTYAHFWRSIAKAVGPACVPFFKAISDRLLREVQVARGTGVDGASPRGGAMSDYGSGTGVDSTAMSEGMSLRSGDGTADGRSATDLRSTRSGRSLPPLNVALSANVSAASPTLPRLISKQAAAAERDFPDGSDDDEARMSVTHAAPVSARRGASTADRTSAVRTPGDTVRAPMSLAGVGGSLRGTMRGIGAPSPVSPATRGPKALSTVVTSRMVRPISAAAAAVADTASHTSSVRGRAADAREGISVRALAQAVGAATATGTTVSACSDADSDAGFDLDDEGAGGGNEKGAVVAAGLGDEGGYVSVLLEVLGGLLRAAVFWNSLDAQRAAWELGLDALDGLLTPSLPANSFLCVVEFVGYLSDDIDPRRLRPLRRFFYSVAARACHDALMDVPRASALVVSRALQAYKANADLASRGGSCCEAMGLGAVLLMAHRFEAVRSVAVQLLSLAICDQNQIVRGDDGLARPLGLDEVPALPPLVLALFEQLALGVAVADAVVRGVTDPTTVAAEAVVAERVEAAVAAVRCVSAEDKYAAGLSKDSPFAPPLDASSVEGWLKLVGSDDDAARLCEAVVDLAVQLSAQLSGPAAITKAFTLVVAAISVQPKHTSDKLANALPALTALAGYSQTPAAARALAQVVVSTIQPWIDDTVSHAPRKAPKAAPSGGEVEMKTPSSTVATARGKGTLDRWRSRVVVFSFLPPLLYKHAAALIPLAPLEEPLLHEAAPLRKARRKRAKAAEDVDPSTAVVTRTELFDEAVVSQWPGVRLVALCVDVLQSSVPELREVAMSVVSLATLALPKALVGALLARFDAQRAISPPNPRSFSRVRHAGVLGVAAMLGAFVDDVPPLVPTLLERLAAHADDHPTTAAVVKDAFTTSVASWWSTHRDFWPYLREHFSEAQQETIYALNYSPAFYA